MRITTPTFTRIATLAVIGYALLVVTGGAVRLTGSGLGCPDWPTCYAHHITAATSFHQWVEFGNRLVSVLVTITSIGTFVAALALSPRRRDLIWLAGGLVAGILAQVVLGGLLVLFSLNPYLVALHFLLTLVILAGALVLRARSRSAPGPREAAVGNDLLWLARLLVAVLAVLVSAGTVVSGAGPHAGATGTKRIDIAFRDIAEVHSTIALFLIGCTLATLFALHQARAPSQVQRAARVFLEVLALQGTVGYTQYFLHDSAALVEVHLAGATAAWIAVIAFYLSLHRASDRRGLLQKAPRAYQEHPTAAPGTVSARS